MSTTTSKCCYCGDVNDITRDHVPPESLFSKPKPSNLITVPCCIRCNKEFSKNDEYFRLAIMTGMDPQKFPKENADSIRAINNLGRPESLGFASRLIRDYDRASGALRIEGHRIEIALHRIVRGLFYHRSALPLPADVQFRCLHADASLGDREIDLAFEEWNPVTIGNDIFRYDLFYFDFSACQTIWLFEFYSFRRFICFTGF